MKSHVRTQLVLSNVRITRAGAQDSAAGLLGWISCTVNGSLRLDGLALRRTSAGALTLSFPARKDRLGNLRFHVRPLDDESRDELERQILDALGLRDRISR